MRDFVIIMVVGHRCYLGFIQEYQACKIYIAQRVLKPTTSVIRDGERIEIDLQDLVPDDIALINAGEHIPGDGILLEATKLTIDESILTGESEPVQKTPLQLDTNATKQNLVSMGTTVVSGRGQLCRIYRESY
jgi:P-type E1-E2 ATPase